MTSVPRVLALLCLTAATAHAQQPAVQPTVLRPAREHSPGVGALAWLPDGSALIVVTGVDVERVDARTGKVAWTLPPQAGGRMGGEDSSSVVISHDGKLVALACNDDRVRLLEADSGTEIARLDVSGRVLAFQHEDLVVVVREGWTIKGVELADLKVRWSVDAEDQRWLGTYQGRGLVFDDDEDRVRELDLYEGPLPEGTDPWAPVLPRDRRWMGAAITEGNDFLAWAEGGDLTSIDMIGDVRLQWARDCGGVFCPPAVGGMFVAVAAFPGLSRRDATRLLVLDTRDGDEVLDVELAIDPEAMALAPDGGAVVLGGDDGELLRVELPRPRER